MHFQNAISKVLESFRHLGSFSTETFKENIESLSVEDMHQVLEHAQNTYQIEVSTLLQSTLKTHSKSSAEVKKAVVQFALIAAIWNIAFAAMSTRQISKEIGWGGQYQYIGNFVNLGICFYALARTIPSLIATGAFQKKSQDLLDTAHKMQGAIHGVIRSKRGNCNCCVKSASS